ncbi:Beta-lactamase [Citrobacter koseri]|uniref:Beta-lactamase n=1 Tax=Citrobacter koseri TaxID=545 RepID=A0A2X2WH39_CITKO|nr:Beta-lactamase [Citrobacter koseri]
MLCVSLFALIGCGNSTLSQLDMPAQKSAQVVVGYYGRGIDPMIRQYMREKEVTGVVVAVIQNNGPAEFHSYGITDDKNRYPITPDTLFALGSLSKGVTAEVTTMLVDEGVFNWTDTLETLLHRIRPLSPDAKKYYAPPVVTHTSGLPRQPMDLLTLENLMRYFSKRRELLYATGQPTPCWVYLSDFTAPDAARSRSIPTSATPSWGIFCSAERESRSRRWRNA